MYVHAFVALVVLLAVTILVCAGTVIPCACEFPLYVFADGLLGTVMLALFTLSVFHVDVNV